MFLEAGHAAQNLCLQAAAPDLGSVVIGAFSDRQFGSMLQLDNTGVPVYIIPVGKEEQSSHH